MVSVAVCLCAAVVVAVAEGGVVTRSIRGGSHPSQLTHPRVFRQSSGCGPGELYVASVDLCVPHARPQRVAPLRSDSLVRHVPALELQASTRVQLALDCRADEVYNSELSLCLKVPKQASRAPFPALSLVKEEVEDVPLESQAFGGSSQSPADCKPNEMWLSELSLCVETNNVVRQPSASLPQSASFPKGLQSASLVKETVKTPLAVSKQPLGVARPSSKPLCGPNEIYVAEVGVCQPASPGHTRPLTSASLVKDPVSAMVGARPVFETTKCRPGEIHVSELNMCLPAHGAKRPSRPASASLVKEPEALEITAFAETSSAADCSRGQFFIAELGICA